MQAIAHRSAYTHDASMIFGRNSIWLLVALVFGAVALPFLVYYTGLATLGPYSHGGPFAFYVDFLEFQITFEHRFHDGAPLYMGLERDGVQLNLSGHFGDGSPGAAVRIQCTGLDEYAVRLRGKKYRHANPGDPQDREWGCRELAIQELRDAPGRQAAVPAGAAFHQLAGVGAQGLALH